MGFHLLKHLSVTALVASLAIVAQTNQCGAHVEREDANQVSHELKMPVYQWQNKQGKPQGVVIAVHGLIKHGAVFDKLGTHLASKGYIVVAQDLRGYGRWVNAKENFPGGQKISYEKSYEDLVNLAARMRSLHPGMPIFCVGESLGADLALHLAGVRPDLTDGLVLASPAIRHHHRISKQLVVDAAKFVTNPSRPINMNPYIKNYTSDDPRIIDESLKDPMVRRSLNAMDLLRSRKTMKETLHYARSIPPHIPILIIQGGADKIVKAQGIVALMTRLKSTDQSVRWLDQSGHVLLETSFISDSTLSTIDDWLNRHLPGQGQNKQVPNGETVLSSIPILKMFLGKT